MSEENPSLQESWSLLGTMNERLAVASSRAQWLASGHGPEKRYVMILEGAGRKPQEASFLTCAEGASRTDAGGRQRPGLVPGRPPAPSPPTVSPGATSPPPAATGETARQMPPWQVSPASHAGGPTCPSREQRIGSGSPPISRLHDSALDASRADASAIFEATLKSNPAE